MPSLTQTALILGVIITGIFVKVVDYFSDSLIFGRLEISQGGLFCVQLNFFFFLLLPVESSFSLYIIL